MKKVYTMDDLDPEGLKVAEEGFQHFPEDPLAHAILGYLQVTTHGLTRRSEPATIGANKQESVLPDDQLREKVAEAIRTSHPYVYDLGVEEEMADAAIAAMRGVSATPAPPEERQDYERADGRPMDARDYQLALEDCWGVIEALKDARQDRATLEALMGYISADLAARAGAWDGNAPDWFPDPPEWLEILDAGLAAVGPKERDR